MWVWGWGRVCAPSACVFLLLRSGFHWWSWTSSGRILTVRALFFISKFGLCSGDCKGSSWLLGIGRIWSWIWGLYEFWLFLPTLSWHWHDYTRSFFRCACSWFRPCLAVGVLTAGANLQPGSKTACKSNLLFLMMQTTMKPYNTSEWGLGTGERGGAARSRVEG